MTFARAANLPKGLGRAAWRRAGSSSSRRSWKQGGRRGYASDHGHGSQQSSELPWIIGSVAITVPSAAWLLQQGPKTGDHGHGHESHGEEHEEKEEEEEEEEPKEEEQPQEEESKDEEPKEESKDEDKDEEENKSKDEDKEEDKDESKDESKDEGDEQKGGDDNLDEHGYEKPGPNAPKQINWTSASKKGPGEQQKGERAPSEKKGEKDSASDKSGAKHPYLDDPEKSKKGAGPVETAKIHGTVDSRQDAR